MRSSFILPSLRDLWGGVLHLLYPFGVGKGVKPFPIVKTPAEAIRIPAVVIKKQRNAGIIGGA